MFNKTKSLIMTLCIIITMAQAGSPWNNADTYDVGDTVTYDGSCYVAIREVYQNTTPLNDWFWNELSDCRDDSGDSVHTNVQRFQNDIILENGAKLIVRDSSSIVVENALGPFTISGDAITINSRGSQVIITHKGIQVIRGGEETPVTITSDGITCANLETENATFSGIVDELKVDDLTAQRIEVKPIPAQ